MNIILSAGMPRSGSTWLYNALRLILLSSPKVRRSFTAGWVGDILKLPRERTMLIKIHDYDAQLNKLSKKVFYSYRDPRATLLSLQAKFGQEPRSELLNYLMQIDRDWRSQAHYIMKYENMMQDKMACLNALAQELKLPETDTKDILRQLEELKFESQGERGDFQGSVYNKDNLFHQGHITGAKATELPSALENEIWQSYGDWMLENGYSK